MELDIVKEENLRKSSHKLLLLILKVIPMVTAFYYVLNTIAAYFNIDMSALSMLGGMSLLPWLFILVATFVFKFCIYHRMFLYYIFTSDIVSIYDFYFGIPISNMETIMLQFCIIGIFLFLILYFYVKRHKKVIGKNT